MIHGLFKGFLLSSGSSALRCVFLDGSSSFLPSLTAWPCRVPLALRLSSCVHCTATQEHLTRRATERPERVARTKRTAQQPLRPRHWGGLAGPRVEAWAVNGKDKTITCCAPLVLGVPRQKETARCGTDATVQDNARGATDPPPATACRRALQTPSLSCGLLAGQLRRNAHTSRCIANTPAR